jgi:hypothetical protein
MAFGLALDWPRLCPGSEALFGVEGVDVGDVGSHEFGNGFAEAAGEGKEDGLVNAICGSDSGRIR